MVQKKAVTLGTRFYAEFGTQLLAKMAKELIFGEVEESSGEEEENAEAEGQLEEGEPEQVPEPEPSRRSERPKKKKRGAPPEVVDSD
jgi:hypothetical protein